jgi:hypothetical protein
MLKVKKKSQYYILNDSLLYGNSVAINISEQLSYYIFLGMSIDKKFGIDTEWFYLFRDILHCKST